ncbi:MAG: CopG family ribbon-helix-helix protein [Inquilinus sp.]|uniref:CopG family ribbon-helix-helix protein n=1 Tax=Inquilinus sp. TaxID=1932117 RepID=UPI003F2EC8CA
MQRFSISVSDNLAEKLDEISRTDEQTKNEILRKALTLYVVAHEARKRGEKVGTVEAGGKLDTEFVGL